MEYFDRETLNEKKIEWLNILHENELSDNSIKRYTINITFFINYISEKKIDKETIKSFKDTLISDRKYLSNTANNYLITANNFLRFLDLENLCVKLFKIQRKDHLDDPITYTDYHRLLRCALAKDKENIYLLIRILGETGIRVGELKYFKIEDLKTDLIIRFKNKERSIIITRNLLTTIRKYALKNKIKSGYLFPGKSKNKPIATSTVRSQLKKAAGYAKVKLDKVHPHAFRHYFATRFLEEFPGQIAILSDLLGHSSIETTRIYVRLSNKQKELSLRKVKF